MVRKIAQAIIERGIPAFNLELRTADGNTVVAFFNFLDNERLAKLGAARHLRILPFQRDAINCRLCSLMSIQFHRVAGTVREFEHRFFRICQISTGVKSKDIAVVQNERTCIRNLRADNFGYGSVRRRIRIKYPAPTACVFRALCQNSIRHNGVIELHTGSIQRHAGWSILDINLISVGQRVCQNNNVAVRFQIDTLRVDLHRILQRVVIVCTLVKSFLQRALSHIVIFMLPCLLVGVGGKIRATEINRCLIHKFKLRALQILW